MKMKEDENIAKYVERIKASASAIRAFGGEIKEETIISKVLKTLLPIYEIRVSAIQERRCEENHKITLDAIMGRLTTFELDNSNNYVLASKNIESLFEAKLSLKEKGKKIKTFSQKVKKNQKKFLKVILKFLKHYLQGNILEAEENTKVKFP